MGTSWKKLDLWRVGVRIERFRLMESKNSGPGFKTVRFRIIAAVRLHVSWM